jgi:hypothetical protein
MKNTGTGTRKHSERAPRGATTEIRTFRLADYGLIDVCGAAPRDHEVQRALLWEWSTSPAGVLVRVNTERPPGERTVRAITAAAAELVQQWPGTPIGFISDSQELRELVAQDPQGHHLVIATTLSEVWDGMWSRGGKANLTIELPPSVQAPRTARDVVVRACADWDLDTLATPAALLTGDLVARSVIQGAQDIRFTVSRHNSRIRVLARDDVPSTAADAARSLDAVFGLPFAPPALSEPADSFGEFALDGHHVRWGVVREPSSERKGRRPTTSHHTAA